MPRLAAAVSALTTVTGVDSTRAQAGDDQQGQGLVSGLMPAPVQQPGREQAQGNRQHQHDGGIDLGEAVDKALVGALEDCACSTAWTMRAIRLSLAGAVTRSCSSPSWLMEPAYSSSPGPLCASALSPVMGAWLTELSLGDQAVQRHASAGRHAQHGAQGHLAGGHAHSAAVGLQHIGGLGRQLQQIADGQAGLVHGLVFDALGRCIKRHDHGGFGPLADDEGARDGHGHQGMNAELEAQQIPEPAL
jgi:hypothetical protein